MDEQTNNRLQAKTPEQRFLSVLENDFDQPPRVAQVLLQEAQTCLLGHGAALRPGQMRVILTRLDAAHGQALGHTARQEVIWTVDAGMDDRHVQQQHGLVALRQIRLQRLLDEALAQGAAATQEDLAQALHVSVRTIKRDCQELEGQGLCVLTRGKVKGLGRGQTHKAQIVARWLRGETYDQIMVHTRHSQASIQRYVQTFVRVIDLHSQGFGQEEIALLLELSVPLVREYLAVYEQHRAPVYRERLKEQIERLAQGAVGKRGAT